MCGTRYPLVYFFIFPFLFFCFYFLLDLLKYVKISFYQLKLILFFREIKKHELIKETKIEPRDLRVIDTATSADLASILGYFSFLPHPFFHLLFFYFILFFLFFLLFLFFLYLLFSFVVLLHLNSSNFSPFPFSLCFSFSKGIIRTGQYSGRQNDYSSMKRGENEQKPFSIPSRPLPSFSLSLLYSHSPQKYFSICGIEYYYLHSSISFLSSLSPLSSLFLSSLSPLFPFSPFLNVVLKWDRVLLFESGEHTTAFVSVLKSMVEMPEKRGKKVKEKDQKKKKMKEHQTNERK